MGKENSCSDCGKKLGFFSFCVTHNGKNYCGKCYDIIAKQEKKERISKMRSGEYIPKPGEIKWPYCSMFFTPIRENPTSTGGNIARGAVFLPWGVASSIKNRPYVECPHCNMRIPQG